MLTNPETGLTVADVQKSRQQFGANKLTPIPREPLWKKFLEKFDEPIIKILLAAALLSMVVDLFAPGPSGGNSARFIAGGIGVGLAALAIVGAYGFRRAQWVPSILFLAAVLLAVVGLLTAHPSWDGLAVMIAVILATGVAFVSEYKSDREFELLNAHKDAIQVKVRRDGEFKTIPLEEVVVGDLVILEVGDEIPADGHVLKSAELHVDQSLMTGESEPARKAPQPGAATADGPEQPDCLYRGTQVVDGLAQMIVTAVGDATYLGQIARRLGMEEDEEQTPSPPTPLPRSGGEGRPLTPSSPIPLPRSGGEGRPLTPSSPIPLPRSGGEGGALSPSPPTPLPRSGGEGRPLTPSSPIPLPRSGGEGGALSPSPPYSGERGWGEGAERVRRKLSVTKESTPLQEKLEKLADLISKIGYVAAGAIFLALLIRGIVTGEVRWPSAEEAVGPVLFESAGHLLRYFMYMVIIIVVAVPEGLPMSVTVSLALAMRKMTRAHSLVRQLVACETIGSTTVICSDKTGTLTQNKMQVVRLYWDGSDFPPLPGSGGEGSGVRGPTPHPNPSPPSTGERGSELPPLPRYGGEGSGVRGSPLNWIILNAAVNSTANLELKAGNLVPVGNSTEAALLQWLHEAGVEYQTLRLQFAPLYQVHFSSERKRMTTVIRYDDRLIALVKGAPEWVLEQTARYETVEGTTKLWTAEAKEQVRARLRDCSAQAMRTLAFAHATLPAITPSDPESLHAIRDTFEKDLVFAGFIAIRDPLRDDVKEAVQQCRHAGIEVKMITGDNLETARAIGREVGLLDRPDAVVLSSQEFNALTDEQLKEQMPRLRILARARPLDKFRMVKLLQEQNEVVAVTGDGTNDAPALKKADVGLAMGRSGTEVAKEASKIVLLDDAFSTIVKAVHWGRSLYENIQRFIQFQLTINVSALVIAFLGPFFGVKPPFTILQLLWINVIMDTFASIALCSEPPREGLMDMPPKDRSANILTPAMLWNIFTTAAFFIVVMLTLLVGMKHEGWLAGTGSRSIEFPELTTHQVSIFFTLYVMFQVWNEINCRSLVPEVSGVRGVLGNPVFLGIVGLIVIGQAIIITVGGEVFKVEPLAPLDWFWITLASASVLVFAEAVRRIRQPRPPIRSLTAAARKIV